MAEKEADTGNRLLPTIANARVEEFLQLLLHQYAVFVHVLQSLVMALPTSRKKLLRPRIFTNQKTLQIVIEKKRKLTIQENIQPAKGTRMKQWLSGNYARTRTRTRKVVSGPTLIVRAGVSFSVPMFSV